MATFFDVAISAAAIAVAPQMVHAALPLWLLGIGIVLLLMTPLVALAVALYRNVRGPRHESFEPDDADLPPLIVPPGLSERQPVRPPRRIERPAAVIATSATAAAAAPVRALPERVLVPNGVSETVIVPLEEVPAEQVQAGRVRFHRPPEGTLQLLPGRLEIIAGNEQVEEIRFVKLPGRDPVVSFGRNAGEPHTHIQLQSPTVSRMHAVMRFELGRWHIANLSQTNPVLVRGVQLSAQGSAPVPLEDGDEIEMGEVTFRFRVR